VRGVVLVSSKPNGAIAIQRGIGISLADSVRCVGGHHERVCNSELVFCWRLISFAAARRKGGAGRWQMDRLLGTDLSSDAPGAGRSGVNELGWARVSNGCHRKFRGYNFEPCVTNFDKISFFSLRSRYGKFRGFHPSSEFVP
jgi:hypothetical protein